MNSLQNLYQSLRDESNEVQVPEPTATQALTALSRMVAFQA